MSWSERAARLVIRVLNNLVNWVLLIAVMVLIAYGCYGIWDSITLAKAATVEQYEQYKPMPDGGPSFQELQALNPETVAWLQVYGTNIDYPVLQADNNWKYINHNALCEYSLTGSIFMDYQNSADFSDFNTILYGHNMTPKVMFGNIKDFKQQSFFNSHLYGDLYYGGQHHGLEFFAILSVDAYDFEVYSPQIVDAKTKQEYLENLLAVSTYTREIGVSTDDKIVLLSTCSNEATNQRDILVGRVTDTVYHNDFEAEERIRSVAGIDAYDLNDIWNELPLWAWILIALALILVLSAVIFRSVRKRRKE